MIPVEARLRVAPRAVFLAGFVFCDRFAAPLLLCACLLAPAFLAADLDEEDFLVAVFFVAARATALPDFLTGFLVGMRPHSPFQ